MGGIADKEVSVHIVQRTFDLPPIEEVSESRGVHGDHYSVPGRSYFHLQSSTVGALSPWCQALGLDQY